MGEVTLPGTLSGRTYRFKIAGDQPTPQELQSMQSILMRDEQQFATQFEQEFGTELAFREDPGTALGRGLQRGIPQFQSALGSAAEAVGLEGIGDYLESAATERQLDLLRANPTLMESADFRDIRGLSSAGTYLGELLGEQLLTIGGTVAATGAGALAGASLPVSAALGTLAVSYPQLFGSNIQRQEAQVAAGELPDVDIQRAATTAVGQTILETISNVFLAGRVPGGVLRSVLENAPVEALTELGQQALERQQAGLPLDSEDAYREYLDAAVAGGALGGVFGAAGGLRGRAQREDLPEPEAEPEEQFDDDGAPPTAPGPETQEAADVADIDLPDPTEPITAATLAQLGVPQAAGAYRRALATDNREEQLAALESFADATPDARAEANVRTYVEQARESDLGAVSPTLSGVDDVGAGAGVRDTGGAQADTAEGAAAPDAGRLDVSGEPAGPDIGADGARPAPLTEEEAFERAAQQADEARAAAQPEAAPAAEPEVEAEPEPTPEQMPGLDAELAPEVAPAPEVEPEPASAPEEEAIPGFDEMPDETAPKAQDDITAEEIESRSAVAPEPEPEPAPEAEPEAAPAAPAPAPAPGGLTAAEMAPVDRNVVPGRTTGAAGQTIPEGIAPVPSREPALSPLTEGEAEINRAVNAARARKAQQERAADTNAAAEIRRKFAESSPELQEFTREEVVADPDKDITSVEDKQAVIALLNKKFTKREKASTNPEWAAHEYFRKHADVMTALDTIAYDAIAAPTNFAKITNDMSPGAKEYYSNTGRQWGTTAGKWILDNLSRDARLALFERLDFYRPEANKAVQRAVSDSRDAAVKRDRQYREYMGDQTGDYVGVTPDTETAQELGFGTEDLSDLDALFSPIAALDMPMHPQVVRAFMRGDINAVLDGIIATAGSVEASKLAAKLRPFVQNVTLRSFSPTEMADLNEVFGDGRRESAAGVYVFRYNEADLQAAETYAPERVALRRELGGSVILNSQTGFTPSTLLHELIHVATTATLDNKAHPLTRQVESLLAKAREIIPAYENGLLNRYEFVSEAMTNPAFIQALARIDIGLGKEKFTLRQRIMNTLRNFVRQLYGAPQKKLGSAKGKIDELFDGLLAPEPAERGVGSLYEAAFRPDGYRDKMNSMKNRVVEATPQNMAEFKKLARRVFTDPAAIKARDLTIRSSMPLIHIVENAKTYFPSARALYDLVNSRHADQKKYMEVVNQTTDAINDYLKKLGPEGVQKFSNLIMEATRLQVDPRKPRSAYDQFELTYNVLDADGDVVETKTERFRTREARAARYKRLKDNPQPSRSAPRNSYDPTTDENVLRLEAFDRIKRVHDSNSFGLEGRAAVNQAFGMYEQFLKELGPAIQARLDTMLPGQETMQRRVYDKFFRKIFSGKLIEPYLPLQRRGDFGLSYTAYDPVTNSVEVYKHFFQSRRTRATAIRYLEEERARSPQSQINDIQPYDAESTDVRRQRPPMEFVVSLLNKIEGSDQLKDPKLMDDLLDLYFESTPESSFLKAFEQRKGVRGFELDTTPLEELLQQTQNSQDVVANLNRGGMRTAFTLADIKYRTKADALQQRRAEEKKNFADNVNPLVEDPLEREANLAEMNLYDSVLNDYVKNATFQRNAFSRNLNALGYVMYLGGNVSTAFLSLFGMVQFVVPMLAPKHGSRNTTSALGAASRILAQSGGTRMVSRVGADGQIERVEKRVPFYDKSIANLDYEQPQNAWLKPLFEAGELAGAFTRSAAQDSFDATRANNIGQKIAAWSGLFQHLIERYVRESTMSATYMLELYKSLPQQNTMSFKQFQKQLRENRIPVPEGIAKAAATEALRITDMTNGSIYASTAQLFSMGNFMSNIYLFKRYPLAMLNLLASTLKESLKGATPEDRRIAMMQFASILGATGMLSGIAGLPGFYLFEALYNSLKDDEDEDFETMVRTGVLGERGLTGLVDYYTGLSIGSRTGLSGAFYRPGFGAEDQPLSAVLFETFGGPLAGLVSKYGDRVPYFLSEGEYWRATEAAMPTALGNAMKSMRFATEGVRTMRHDPIIDDIGPFGVGAQFFGFMPKEYARQLAQNNYLRGMQNTVSKKRTQLLSRRNKAILYGDPDELRDVERDIREFNRTYPEAEIDRDSKEKSLESFERRTEETHHGLYWNKRYVPMLEQGKADFGRATVFSD